MKNIIDFINEGAQDCINKIFAKDAKFPMTCEIPVLDPDTIKKTTDTVKIVYATKEPKYNTPMIICEYPEGMQDYYWTNKNGGMFNPFSEPDKSIGEYWKEELNMECPKEYANRYACKEY